MRKIKRLTFGAILIITICCSASISYANIKDGAQLIEAMHKKYAGKWYRTLTFKQKNTEYKPDGSTENSIWHEAMSAPGKLRIDFDPINKGDGLLFADSVQYNFKDGKLVNSHPLIHSLLVLGFDVYIQPTEKTIRQLKELKFDLQLLREDVWQGKPVYVVGAKAGDLKSAQFWIDKKNLLFVRMIEPVGRNQDHTREVQFNKYQKIKNGAWISPEVVMLIDGKKNWIEEYTDMQTNVSLDADLFDTNKWTTVDRNYLRK